MPDTCKLPLEVGPCRASIQSWGYNSETGQCEEFTFGGCRGNDNNFSSRENCQEFCGQTSTTTTVTSTTTQEPSTEKCSLPIESGPCRAYMPSWGYNSERGVCEQFIYGGCRGTDNRFDSKASCEAECGSEPITTTKEPSQDVCTLPIESGPCFAYFPKWGHNPDSKQCEQFIWGGCGGNGNRFDSEASCEAQCGSQESITTLRPSTKAQAQGTF